MGHILIVEDSEESRELLADLLTSRGYGVRTAPNGQVALEQMRQSEAPQLVLLDLTMPVMNGWQLYAAMREDPRLKEVPVVIISAADSLVVPKGCQGVIPKPIEVELLLAIVRHYLGERAEVAS
ncbi:MAG: response regulator [Myxococcota bacterium]